MQVEAGHLASPPESEPGTYEAIGADGVGRLVANNGLPALKIQWDVFHETRSLVGAFGSWRSGKTRAGALRLLRVAGENPWREIYGRANPFSIVISETNKVLEDATMPELLSVVPKELIRKVWTAKGAQRIRFVNGHDIIFRTWSGAIEGSSACGVWIDEAHKLDGPKGPTDAWTNYVMRATDTRAQGKVVIATGLPEYGYLSDLFDAPPTADRVTHLASLRDNFYLDLEDVRRLRASCTEEEAETVIDGKWRRLKDAVFYAFTEAPAPAGNYVAQRGDPSRPVDLAMDLGELGAILVTQRVRVWVLGPRGQRVRVPGVLVVDEFLPEEMGSEEALLAFRKAKPQWRVVPGESMLYLDPKASRDQVQAIERVLGSGVRVKRQPAKEPAHRREYGYRCCNVGFRDALGNRRLFVWAGLPREKRSLLTALRRHKRKPDGEPHRDNATDHIADCLRYVVADQLPLTEGGVVVQDRAT
jgi:hypothetical protein